MKDFGTRQLYTSPQDINTEAIILDFAHKAKEKFIIGAYSFTISGICDTMVQGHLNGMDVKRYI